MNQADRFALALQTAAYSGINRSTSKERVLGKVSDIQVLNFQESLKLTQRSIYLGLLVSGIVYYLGNLNEGRELPSVPFLDVEFTSLESLQIVLLVLYIGAGIVAWFSSSRALNILSQIEDYKLAMALSKYPCLIASNVWFRCCLAGALGSVGYFLLSSIFVFENILEYSLYIIVSMPFFATLQTGSDIHSWSQNDTES